MKYYFLILLYFLTFTAKALTIEQALKFEKALKEGACRQEFFEVSRTELKEPFLILWVDDCSSRGNLLLTSKGAEVKNLYSKLEVAKALREIGRESEARELFKEVFSSPMAPSEDVISLNLKDTSFLFQPKLLRKKVLHLAYHGNIDEALFYLSFLRDDPYYTYLLAYTYMKSGKKKLSRELFKLSLTPKSLYYLLILSEKPVEKLHYFREIVKSSLPVGLKRVCTVYLLDYLFWRDLGLFRRALNLVKDKDELRRVYLYFKDRYSFFINGCSSKISEFEPQKWWKVSCGQGKELPEGITFYSLLLNPPKFPFNREEVFSKLKLKDKGLNYLYSKGYCQVLTLVEEKNPQTALLLYLCGDYRKGIKFALPFKGKLKEYPFLLPVLYPRPPVFGNDLISLSIARQESLFEPRALSRSGAIGLMQIMPRTGKYIAEKLGEKGFKIGDLYRPELNYKFGSYYIHSLLKRFKLFPLAAAAYNGGPSRISKALNLYGSLNKPGDVILFTDIYIPFEQTRDYVKKTAINLFFYSNLYGTGQEWRSFLRP